MISSNQLYLAQSKISMFTSQYVVSFCLDKFNAWPPTTPSDNILSTMVDNFVDNIVHERTPPYLLETWEEFLINQINTILIPDSVHKASAEGC